MRRVCTYTRVAWLCAMVKMNMYQQCVLKLLLINTQEMILRLFCMPTPVGENGVEISLCLELRHPRRSGRQISLKDNLQKIVS